MRKLVIITAILAALYSAYWGVGRVGLARGIPQAQAALAAQGVNIGYQDLTIQGFPSRFDTTLTGVHLTTQSAEWKTPLAQLFALSYRPNHIIAYLPGPHTVLANGIAHTLTPQDMRASVQVGASTTLPLKNATIELTNATLSNDEGTTQIAKGLAALRHAGPGDNQYDVYAQFDQITPDVIAAIDPNAHLPRQFDVLRLDALATLSEPLNRETSQPALTALNLREATMVWGDIQITIKGDLTVAAGVPSGAVTVTIKGWQAALAMLTKAGIIAPQSARQMSQFATPFARGDDTLDLPITLRDGTMWVGPLPIGPAPRLPL